MALKTPDTTLTPDMIRQAATSAIFARGDNYFRSGRVSECIEVEPGVVEGMVRGSGRNLYSTKIDFTDDRLRADCSCPYGWHDVCKHAVALGLEYIRLSAAAEHRQAEMQALNKYGSYETATTGNDKSSDTNGNANDTKNTTWQKALDGFASPHRIADDIGTYRTIYRLEILRRGRLALRTTKARIGKNGKGKEDSYYFDRYSPSVFLHKKDRAILGLLEYGFFSDLSGTIDDDILDPLLRMLRDEDYVYAGNSETKVSINLDPIKVKVILEENADDHLLRLAFEPDEVNKHPDSLHVFGHDKPWISNGYAFHPVETNIPGSVMAELLHRPCIINRSQIDSFIESYYDLLAHNESVEIKSDLLDDIRDDVVLRPVVHIGNDRGLMTVELFFAYGDGPPQVKLGSSARITAVSIGDKSVWARRRVEDEERFLKVLQEEGVRIDTDTGSVGYLFGEDALDFLYHSVDKLRDQGWEIIYKTDLMRINRSKPKVSASVSSGIDWFDLQFGFDFGNTAVELPAVLAAYKSGRKYIQLDDGSWGALPLEWLKKSNPLLEELGERNGNESHRNTVRIRNYLVPFVEDMVSEIDFRSTVDFDSLRERLGSFNGLDRVDIPAGLNATLRDYQHKGLNWLGFLDSFSFGGILADDMGLGKTIQTLAHLLKHKESGPATSLIVAPTSVAYNWKDEADRFAPGINVLVLTGPDRSAKFDDISKADIVITTYALLRRDFEILSKHNYSYIVLDEAQYIKNPTAQTSKLCKALKAKHRLALTGTPIENSLTELWSIFDFLMPGFLGSHKSFRDRYEKPIAKAARESDAVSNINAFEHNIESIDVGNKTDTGTAETDNGINSGIHVETNAAITDGDEALERLRKRIKPFILRRLKQEVATELPPKTEVVSFCEMTSSQQNLYRQVLNTYRAKVLESIENKGIERSHITILDALLKLRQVCNHPQLLKVAANNIHTSGKMDALKEMIEQLTSEGHKALVFSQFTQMLGIIRDWLNQANISYCYLDGRTRNRRQAIDNFNNSEIPLFLISLKAGGTGLNLTAADYVIHIDPWWNPAVESQATDRAYRIGQDKHVFVYKLITKNSIEEKILKLQERKKELVDGLLAEGSIGRSLTREDIDELLSV
jgi:SNF2 family DNA or RNA helicase